MAIYVKYQDNKGFGRIMWDKQNKKNDSKC